MHYVEMAITGLIGLILGWIANTKYSASAAAEAKRIEGEVAQFRATMVAAAEKGEAEVKKDL